MAEADAPTPSPTPDPAAATAPAASAAPAPTATPDPAKPAEAAAPAPSPAPVVPEKYDFKAPDGMTLNQPMLDAVTPLFKEAGLTQESATKIFDAYNKALQAEETKREADYKAWMADTVKGYQTTLRTEWGANFDANMAVAQRGMARVADADAKRIMDETGMGSHPSFVKLFHQIGKMVSEDKPPNGAQPTGRKSNEAVFYGTN